MTSEAFVWVYLPEYSEPVVEPPPVALADMEAASCDNDGSSVSLTCRYHRLKLTR